MRADAQTEVKVPALNGRKAYSYFRNASMSKKGAIGAGAAIALGGLAAAAIAMRKKPEESNALPASVATLNPAMPQPTEVKTGRVSKKIGDVAGAVSGAIAVDLAAKFAVKQIMKDRKAPEQKEAVSREERRKVWKEKRAKENDDRETKKKAFENQAAEVQASPVNEVVAGGAMLPTRLPYTPPAPKTSAGALTVTPSDSGKNSGSAIAEPEKSRITKVAGSAGAALAKIVYGAKAKMGEGVERDRVAREKFANKNIDLNEASKKAGTATRSALNSTVNLASSFMQTFVKDKNTVNVKASEVKTVQKAMPSKARRANKTINTTWNRSTRRYESLESRIDSFVLSLK